MTEASHNTFIDRRTSDQRMAMLATQVIFWYDEEGKGQSWFEDSPEGKKPTGRVLVRGFNKDKMKCRRTNGLAVTTDGNLVVARAVCSREDQFCKVSGRTVVSRRIEGRAKKHCWVLTVDANLEPCEAMAEAYREMFPGDVRGAKRAYNAGNIFERYKAEMTRIADGMYDV